MLFLLQFWESFPVKYWFPLVSSESVGIAVFVVGLIYYFNAALTFFWIRSQRGKALEGDEFAAKYVSNARCMFAFILAN
jgi:hypothetical protein